MITIAATAPPPPLPESPPLSPAGSPEAPAIPEHVLAELSQYCPGRQVAPAPGPGEHWYEPHVLLLQTQAAALEAEPSVLVHAGVGVVLEQPPSSALEAV